MCSAKLRNALALCRGEKTSVKFETFRTIIKQHYIVPTATVLQFSTEGVIAGSPQVPFDNTPASPDSQQKSLNEDWEEEPLYPEKW